MTPTGTDRWWLDHMRGELAYFQKMRAQREREGDELRTEICEEMIVFWSDRVKEEIAWLARS